MATKTFKIGEYCKGGVITVETKGNKVAIIGKQWDFSQGSRRSSNQSNAEEFTRCEFDAKETAGAYREAFNFLHDLTTSYYAEQVLEWIKGKVTDNNFFNFY